MIGKGSRQRETKITSNGLSIIRKQEQDKMLNKWRMKLAEKTNMGRGFSWEVLSSFKDWMDRQHGELTFQATQLITGHGCFRGCTHRIEKAENSECSFCGWDTKNNLQVLLECHEWREEREEMNRVYGGRIGSLGALLRVMVGDANKWKAMIDFSTKVMDRKEVVEREEQAEERYRVLIRETEEILGVRDGVGRRSDSSLLTNKQK